MKLQINKKTQIETLADISFFLYLFTEFLFKHTIIGQIGILLFAGSVYLLIISKKKVHFSFYFFFYAAFIIFNYINIKLGNSIQPKTSFEMIQTLIINFIILFLIFNYLIFRKDVFSCMFIYDKASFFFTIIAFILSIPNLITQRLGGDFTLLGLHISLNSNTIALIAAYACLFNIYCYMTFGDKNKIMYVIWYILVVLLSGSRKGLLVILLGFIILLFLMYPKKRMRNILSIIIFLLTFYLLITHIPGLYYVIGYRLEALINYILGNSYNEASLATRLSYIELGWNFFLEKPWTGYGLDCFRYLPKAYNTYSHNNFIEILVSGGIIAFILYYIQYIIIILKIFFVNRRLEGSNKKIINFILCIMLVILVMDYGMVSYYERFILTLQMFGLAQLRFISK